MAHSKSARKRIRQNATSRLRNRSAKSALRTTIKKFTTAVASGDKDAAAAKLRAAQKDVDKTASRGIIHKKSAARIKSRLTAKLGKMKAGAKASEEAGENASQ